MKVSFNWLKEFVDIAITPTELADRLSLAGTEVESIQTVGSGISNVVTARIESIDKHPDADRLVVTQVFDGTETHQVVTGATNVFVGAIVPLSRVGATLKGGFTIKASKLRGVPSNGMLCSESELGIVEESSGIWILPPNTPLGKDFAEYAQLEDTILEIGILPNRGDCQSMIGIAREVAAILNLPLRLPEIRIGDSLDSSLRGIGSGSGGNANWTVLNQAPEFCTKYTARCMSGVAVGPSPIWMQRRLHAGGIRPINNMVDVSNYVLLESGQPLHIFDAALLPGHAIGIRLSDTDEEITTLDGVTRKLPHGIGVITDGTHPVAVAGVMGGEHSGVSEHTTSILIESAYFQPGAIRTAMRQMALRSESSIRFEKGVDFGGIEWASDRAATLVLELGGGKVDGPLIVKSNDSAQIAQDKWIGFNVDQINGLLGSEFTATEITATLEKLGFEIRDGQAKVPSWRRLDIQEWPDLAEEVARVIGLDKIATRLPISDQLLPEPSKLTRWINQISERLVAAGFCEIRSLPMISPKDAELDDQVPTPETTMQNPMTPEESIMSASHLARLAKTMAYNLNRQQHNIRLFEYGRVFSSANGAISETVELAGLVCGRETPLDYTEDLQSTQSIRFSHIKSVLESALAPITIEFEASSSVQLHPSQQVSLRVSGTSIGHFGALTPQLASAFEIPNGSLYFSINLNSLLTLNSQKRTFKPFSKFPSTRRDIAILAPKSLPYSEILKVIDAYKSPAVVDVFLFDCYESEKLGADHRSLAVGLIYQDLDKSLSEEDVAPDHQILVAKLTEALPVTIR